MNYPSWIINEVRKNKKELRGSSASDTASDLRAYRLHTVCDEALCPNKGNCFKSGEATFLILGDICTRNCGFCAVKKTRPQPLDTGEPSRIAALVKKWKLKYAVFTSPTRDDLSDGGASHYASVIKEIKKISPDTCTEPLIPDFLGDMKAVETVIKAEPSVLAHNVEMAESLYSHIRKGANYERSLAVLKYAKEISPNSLVKSGIMLGLGETDGEIKKTIEDLAHAGCDLLNIGQYIPPSSSHWPVKKFYSLEEFLSYEKFSLSLGFKAVLSGPLVRSSYKARELYLKAAAR
ncbi:MAG: lipoyl synthase [Elusimicrobiota bacterium]